MMRAASTKPERRCRHLFGWLPGGRDPDLGLELGERSERLLRLFDAAELFGQLLAFSKSATSTKSLACLLAFSGACRRRRFFFFAFFLALSADRIVLPNFGETSTPCFVNSLELSVGSASAWASA